MLPPSHHTLETIWGHEPIKKLVPRMLRNNRLPHALLLHGPDGVGKRSLAFALAKVILSSGLHTPGATITAPRGAQFLWHFEEPDRSDDEDMFGGMDDMFGGDEPESAAEEEIEKEERVEAAPSAEKEKLRQAPEPPKKKPAPKKPKPTPPAVAAPSREPILDERVNKLVSKSYPVVYEGDAPVVTGFVDLNIVEPVKSKSIKVEQIRTLQDVGWMAPLEGAYRVVLVFGADTITASAANSLLKLLEEPPSHLVMILVTDHYHRVLETIRSRCATLLCNPLDRRDLTTLLVQEEKADPHLAEVAAALSEGRPGVALDILSGDLLKQREEIFQARLGIDRSGPSALPHAVSHSLKAGKTLGGAAMMLIALARDRMVRNLVPSAEHLLINSDLQPLLDEVRVDPASLYAESERLLECLRMDDHPVVPAPEPSLELALWPDA